MVRTSHTLTLASLLLLSACPSTDNNVGTVLRDGGGAGVIPQHPYVASGASCINYPSTGYRIFPFDPSIQTGQGGQSWPTCTLNCNAIMATAGDGQAPLDQALPDGPCDDEGASCNSPLMAGWCGPCANTGGPGNGYTCTCRAHKWQCALGPNVGANACDPPTCLDPSLSANFPPPQSCSQITWSATQVCGCGTCQDLCSSDTDCQSGHCNLTQVCRFPDGCAGSADCRATCTGICEPAAGDGGQRAETGNVAPAGNNLGWPCYVGFTAGASVGGYNSEAAECTSRLCLKPVVQSNAGSVDTGAFCTGSCSTDDDCSTMWSRNPNDPNDHTCGSGFTCGVAFANGAICCQKLCICKDFTGGASIPTPIACQGAAAQTCNQ
jgi:hypothetical protein